MTTLQAIATISLACGLGQPVRKTQVQQALQRLNPQAATLAAPVLKRLPEVSPGVLDPKALPVVHVRNRARYRRVWA